MSRQAGRNLSLSPFRKLVVELMHHCQKVPGVTSDRPMNLAQLIEARRTSLARPSWSAIFLKAMSIVAMRRPEFRQAYMGFPWPHLYEHPINVASFTIERRHLEEDIVFFVQVRRPENRTLAEIDQIIQNCKNEPLESLKFYRRTLRMSKVPWPFRRFVWWASLNIFGKIRAHNFGTFTLTTTSGEGAGIQTLPVVSTSTLHYGLFDERGNLPVRLTFDHRVLDGATAARALADMESVLQSEILSELRDRRLRLAV
jgi:2-oxoacid dehydrogenases acyltransferase (catalytic domain)